MATSREHELLLRYLRSAREAGCPRDQMERFVVAGYIALPHQLAFHAAARACDSLDGPELIGFGGARGPGKTHASLAQVGLDDCQRYPGLKFLFLRKIARAGQEAFEDLRRKLFRNVPHEYRKADRTLEFTETGSRIVLGHFKDESDIDKFLGIEYDGAAIEEATQLGSSKVNAIRGSIRTSKQGWKPRIYFTTNPGGIGHQHFRSTFVLPYRKGEETTTRFIPATARQNRYLDDGYRRYLDGLTGALGAMWRDGDWDVAGGAYFSNWKYDRVVARFEVQEHWGFYLAMDYGWSHPTVIYLLAKGDDGQALVIDEHAASRTQIADHADAVAAMLARHGVQREQIKRFVAGADCFSAKDNGKTIADSWAELGWTLERAKTDRISGAAEVSRRLGSDEQPATEEQPGRPARPATLTIHPRCGRLIETIPMLLSDPSRPEDVLKVDVDEDGEGGDDPYDAARYGLMELGAPPRQATGKKVTGLWKR